MICPNDRYFKIRAFQPRDARSLMRVERSSFDAPWTAADFEWLCKRPQVVTIVAVSDTDEVLGFVVYRRRRDDSLLLNFATAPLYRQQGIASSLIQTMVADVRHSDRKKAVAHVWEYFESGLICLRSNGFRATGEILHHWDAATGSDAFVLEYDTVNEIKPEATECRIPTRNK